MGWICAGADRKSTCAVFVKEDGSSAPQRGRRNKARGERSEPRVSELPVRAPEGGGGQAPVSVGRNFRRPFRGLVGERGHVIPGSANTRHPGFQNSTPPGSGCFLTVNPGFREYASPGAIQSSIPSGLRCTIADPFGIEMHEWPGLRGWTGDYESGVKPPALQKWICGDAGQSLIPMVDIEFRSAPDLSG